MVHPGHAALALMGEGVLSGGARARRVATQPIARLAHGSSASPRLVTRCDSGGFGDTSRGKLAGTMRIGTHVYLLCQGCFGRARSTDGCERG